eukprot:1597319-Amphidinium_carterae.1
MGLGCAQEKGTSIRVALICYPKLILVIEDYYSTILGWELVHKDRSDYVLLLLNSIQSGFGA